MAEWMRGARMKKTWVAGILGGWLLLPLLAAAARPAKSKPAPAHSTTSPASAAPDAGPPSPVGTWIVEKVSSSQDLSAPGITWVVTSKALTFIRDGEVVRHRACALTPMDEGNWALECGETTLVWLPVGTGWTARQGASKAQLRKANAAETAAAAKVVRQAEAATAPACARAKRCCQEAMPLLGTTCGVDELPREELVSECNKVFESYRALLQKAGKTEPKSCAAHP